MLPFSTMAVTEHEKNTDLAIYLVDLLDEQRDPNGGFWQSNLPDRSLACTCQAVEALNQLNLGSLTERMIAPSTDWLLTLPILRALPVEDHKRLRIFPSRFKTLSVLKRFERARLDADFAELGSYLDSKTGCMKEVPSLELRKELVTMIWLDALYQMHVNEIDVEAWQEDRQRALGQLAIAFEDWLAAARPRGEMLLADEGQGSYAFDILMREERLWLGSDHAREALQKMMATILQRKSGGMRNSDSIYCGIQLCNYFGASRDVRENVGTFIREVRNRYVRREYAREQISFHALVLRLLASFYGDALRGSILDAHWNWRRQTVAQRADDERAKRDQEFAKLLQKTFQVHIGKIDRLSGSRSRNQVFRVHFGFETEATDTRGSAFSISDDALHLIIKQGSSDSLLQSIERYNDLPETIKPFFARHTSILQPANGEVARSWYLVMQDLAQMKPLHEILHTLDFPKGGRREHDQIGLIVQAVQHALEAIHRTYQYVSNTGEQMERLYLVPITENLNELVQHYAFPALKPYLEGGFSANDRVYKKAGWFIQRLKSFENKLQPPRLGLIHGDCHTRNLMLSHDLRSAKFVDVEALVKHEDYLADFAILLEDIAFYRLLPPRDHLARMSWDDLRTIRDGTASTDLETYLSYPAFPLGSEITIYLQREIVRAAEEFAATIDDKYWKARLWFAVAKALILLARRQLISHTTSSERRGHPDDFRTVLLAFVEAIRLMDELIGHLDPKINEPLDDIPFPGKHRAPNARTAAPGYTQIIREIKQMFDQLGADVHQHHVTDAPAWIRYSVGTAGDPFAELRTKQKKVNAPVLILFAAPAQLNDPYHLITESTADGRGMILTETEFGNRDALFDLVKQTYRLSGGRG